jgi:circadian clock protein KaiC
MWRSIFVSDTVGTGLDRVPSGVGGLDTILGGGFLQGGLYVLQGAPGTGKTTLGNQICFNHVAAGGRALYLTLLAEYHARMMQHLGSLSFFDLSEIPDQIVYLSGFRILRQDGPKGLLDLLRREILARDISMLVLDGLVAAQRAAADEQAFNEFIHELQGVAIATGCTMFLLTSADDNARVTPEHTMVDGIVTLADQLLGWSAQRTLQVLKFRGSAYLRGKHAFTITDDGLAVYPRIEALLARPSRPEPGGVETTSTGVGGLDKMLGGGLPAGSTTMIMGPTGIGKTTLGLQFLACCSEAEPGLFFGFYETPARIRVKADEVCRPLGSLFDSGAVELLWQPPTAGSIDSYGEQLLDAVRRRGVRRLFIDGLDAFRSTASEPGRMNHFLTALMNELRVQGVTTVYTLEVADIVGPHIQTSIGDLSCLAENLILMRYVGLRSHLYRLISVLKVRDSDFDSRLYQFTLTDQGVVIQGSSERAESIMAGIPPLPEGSAASDEKPQPRHGG